MTNPTTLHSNLGSYTVTHLLSLELIGLHRPYSKSKLELESNLSEIFSVNCKFIGCSTQLKLTKLKLEYLKFGF